MSMIKVEGISKRYQLGHIVSSRSLTNPFKRGLQRLTGRSMQEEVAEEFWALRDVSFDIQQGEVVGIIGKNGAGKSTLLKILSRITDPSSGRIELNGRVSSLLEVGTGFNPELTGRENIFLNGAILGMARREIQSKFDEIVAFAEVEKFLDTPVKRYSSGMYVRLAFAVAAHLEPEILIVDEVLAVGDAEFQRKCLGKMKDVSQDGRTVIFVSHNMTAINHICEKAIWLKNGELVQYGDSNSVVDMYLTGALSSDQSKLLSPGFVFQEPDLSDADDFGITGIQLLDKNNRPMESLGTWDFVKFRIHYSARRFVKRGSVVLKCLTPENASMLLFSTHPDLSYEMSIESGDHAIDLIVPRWPLSAGHYVLAGGLAIPNIEWLCWNDAYCELNVSTRDIYASGIAPEASRYIVAVDYSWDIPS